LSGKASGGRGDGLPADVRYFAGGVGQCVRTWCGGRRCVPGGCAASHGVGVDCDLDGWPGRGLAGPGLALSASARV
jgi:hypothetical protein